MSTLVRSVRYQHARVELSGSLKRPVADVTQLLEDGMAIANNTVLITGANGGIGRALVDDALRRGAARVYSGTREDFDHPDSRVTPLRFDVTDSAQIRTAAERVDKPDVLVNNAGFGLFDDLGSREILAQHLEVILLGTYAVTQAFLPLLECSRGAIVNVLPFRLSPRCPHADLFDLQGSRVLAIEITACAAGAPRCDCACRAGRPSGHRHDPGGEHAEVRPELVARSILDGFEDGQEEIFPDPMSMSMADSWPNGNGKMLEREFAALVQPALDVR
jgi:hypothetical protein